MRVRFEIIEDLSYGQVHFYSACFEEDSEFEFEKFEGKDFPDHQEEIQILYSIINQIIKRGAKTTFFKFEGAAHALPFVNQSVINANEKDWGVRLYCIRLTDDLVILLNGDIKTKLDPSLCDNVRDYFKNANKIAKAIDQACANKEINLQADNPFENWELEI